MDDKLDKDKNTGLTPPDSGDTSAYLDDGAADAQLDFGGLFSNRFTNVRPIYSSPNGATEIYTATRYGKRFVLKGLKEQYRNDPIYNLALAKEFDIGISLDHPNIRRTLGLETVEGIGRVIVLEYVDGTPLDTLLASGDLTVAEARSIATQTAGALGYVHAKQVYHRDLKPANILVAHQGNVVKIIDFNLSDSDEFVILKNPAGSRRYMAPEQQNLKARPSAVADIYSLGVILDELAAASGDDGLSAIAARCANPDPDRRPQSVDRIKLPASRPSAMQSLSSFLSSKTLTYVMLCVCAALAAADVYMLIK
ncbi:MAG: serine/threonine protein kinase [Duncaniella sp.]|nr:serine/threonine protein kinase [Duncaniella sp.]